jgi:hypothetical protein
MVILSSNDLEDQRSLVLSFEGMSKCTKFIKQAAQGPNIAFLVVGFFLTEFRR